MTVALIRSPSDALHGAANVLLLQAAVPLTDWYYSLNAPSWSISTEMFFYLAFPFALAAGRRRPVALALASALLVAVVVGCVSALRLSPLESAGGVTAWGLLYLSPLCRIAEFLTGIAAYWIACDRVGAAPAWNAARATAIEIGAVASAVLAMVTCTQLGRATLHEAAPQLAVWVLVAGPYLAFAVLIALFRAERGLVTRALRWAPLVYLGEISFSLYLVHQLVLRNMFAFFRPAMGQRVAAYAAYWAISLGAAMLLHHVIEAPARRALARRLGVHKEKAGTRPAFVG